MKHPWLAYAVVALLAIGAGVAIAGLPDDSPAADTLVITATSGPTAPGTTDAADTTDAPDTTDAANTTEATVADSTTTSTAATTTISSTTVAPTTEPPTSIPDRADIIVISANGSGLSGAAALNADRLEAAGYVDVGLRNGTQVFDFTVIFYADGFEDAAVRMAGDLELLPEFVAPLADAPVVIELPDDVQLLAYIGIDRA
jgi:hypothetical protein